MAIRRFDSIFYSPRLAEISAAKVIFICPSAAQRWWINAVETVNVAFENIPFASLGGSSGNCKFRFSSQIFNTINVQRNFHSNFWHGDKRQCSTLSTMPYGAKNRPRGLWRHMARSFHFKLPGRESKMKSNLFFKSHSFFKLLFDFQTIFMLPIQIFELTTKNADCAEFFEKRAQTLFELIAANESIDFSCRSDSGASVDQKYIKNSIRFQGRMQCFQISMKLA